MGLAEDLSSLGDLFERGVIDRHHFEEAKARLLGDGGEVATEDAASEDMPTADQPSDVEAPVGLSPSPSLDSAEQAECDKSDDADDEEDVPLEMEPEEEPEGRTSFERLRQHGAFVFIGLIAASVLLIGLFAGVDSNPNFESEVEAEDAQAQQDAAQRAAQEAAQEAYYEVLSTCADDLYWGVATMVDGVWSGRQTQSGVLDHFGSQSWQYQWVIDNVHGVIRHRHDWGFESAVDMAYELAFEECAGRLQGRASP